MSVLVVTCESCETRFRLDSSRLSKARNKVRCTRCGHVFLVDQPEEEDLVRINLSEEEAEEEAVEETFIPGTLTEESHPVSFPPPVKAKSQFSLRRLLVLAIPALILAGGVILYSYNGSVPTGIITAKMPKQSESPQSAVTIMVESLQSYFLENAHGGQLFVVEGEVKNISGKPVSFVVLEGKLLTAGHQVAQVQRCFPGNVMTRQEVASLKIPEIQDRMMNREGKNLRNVRIPPDNRVPFMLVFHNLPEVNSLGDYSVEVVSSELK